MAGLMMVAALAACSGGSDGDGGKDGGDDSSAQVRQQLIDMGYTDDLADCLIDEIGDTDAFMKSDPESQKDAATQAGIDCAGKVDKDSIADTLDETGLDLTDPTARESFITGMTSSGVPEDVANCIVDKAIEQDIEVSELLEPETIQPLAQACQ